MTYTATARIGDEPPIDVTALLNQRRLNLGTRDEDDDDTTVAPQSLADSSKQKLRQYVDRIERLEEKKTELMGQLKEVYAEAKALGFDTRALRQVIRLRKQDARERAEFEMVLDQYLLALGEI